MTYANVTPGDFKQGSLDGKVRPLGFFTGIIKDNQDNQRNGRLRIYIPELGGDPTKEANWHSVQYASPFAGATPLTGNKDGDKTMQGSQISYGFWAIPPDLDNQVLCCFTNGETSQGFWFACVYQENMNHMVPGVANGISTRDDINKINLPVVTEYNKKDKDATKNAGDPKRPIFEPLHNGLDAQGLYADPERGPSTTSARREAPSKVLGLISPRSNSIHIDDNPANEYIRLRSRSGAQILIHETTGYVYMISKQGNSWVEISDIGIDMYSKRSISLRAEENINIHADQNIILNGAGAVHTSGGSLTKNAAGNIHSKAGGDHKTDAKSIQHNADGSVKKTTKDGADKDSAKSEEKAANGGKAATMSPAQQEAGQKVYSGFYDYAKSKGASDATATQFANMGLGTTTYEGLGSNTMQLSPSQLWSNSGDKGLSYGPLQLYTAGGLGNGVNMSSPDAQIRAGAAAMWNGGSDNYNTQPWNGVGKAYSGHGGVGNNSAGAQTNIENIGAATASRYGFTPSGK